MSAAPASSRICLRLARAPHGCSPVGAPPSRRPPRARGRLHPGVRPAASLAAVTERTQQGAAAPWRGGLSGRSLAGLVAVAALAAAVAALALSHGSSSPAHRASAKAAPAAAQHTQPERSAQTSKAAQTGAVRGPAAHATPHSSATRSSASASVHAREAANLVRDPEEANSFPAPPSVKHTSAAAPARAGQAIVAAGAPSDAEVRAELKQMESVERAARSAARQRLAPVAGGRSIGGDGTIAIPQNVPEVVQRVIAGANAIADFPYVFGGGHASFVDNAYDCSGSVSYALAAGGLLGAPETSGDLESWGAPGPGRYITVMANAGHTYMYVNGVMYNTSGRSGVYASRGQVGAVDNSGYVARHWPGL